jgi:hypothetical protein
VLFDSTAGEYSVTIVRSLSCLLVAAFVLVMAPGVNAGDDLETIEVKAKLVEIPSKFPPEDLYDYAYVMQYEVLEGAMKGQKIFVAHFNPRIARKKVKGPAKKWVDG